MTGVHENQAHLGNVTYEDGDPPPPSAAPQSFNAARYLSPHSDIVALMTLEHQSRMQNLITRVGYEARMALESQAAINQALKRDPSENSESTTRRINNAAEELVSYMLFTDEAPLNGKISGTSNFRADFETRGPRDAKGRSLRQFDLTRRMFRYPCSYLIYSAAFDSMPASPSIASISGCGRFLAAGTKAWLLLVSTPPIVVTSATFLLQPKKVCPITG